MNYKEIVLEQLRSMGFELTKADGIGYVFSYEEMNYLYMPDEEDKNFLRFALPNIFDVTDENRVAVLETQQEISRLLKYAKVNIMYESSVWAIYEHYLVSAENLDDLLEHIVRVLMATVRVFHQRIDGGDIEWPSDNDGSDDVDAELDQLLEGIEEDDNV